MVVRPSIDMIVKITRITTTRMKTSVGFIGCGQADLDNFKVGDLVGINYEAKLLISTRPEDRGSRKNVKMVSSGVLSAFVNKTMIHDMIRINENQVPREKIHRYFGGSIYSYSTYEPALLRAQALNGMKDVSYRDFVKGGSLRTFMLFVALGVKFKPREEGSAMYNKMQVETLVEALGRLKRYPMAMNWFLSVRLGRNTPYVCRAEILPNEIVGNFKAFYKDVRRVVRGEREGTYLVFGL